MNIEKTVAALIGGEKYSPDWDLPVRWSTGSFSTLGITFTNSELEMSSLNFASRVQSFKDVLKVWKVRQLSLIGKNIVLKGLAASKLLYCISSVYIEEKTY